MDRPRRRIRALCIIVLVLGLHAAMVWRLILPMRVARAPWRTQSLEMVFIARPPMDPVSENSRETLRESAERQAQGVGPRRRPSEPPRELILQPLTAPARPENYAIHPPIDWGDELARAAQHAGGAPSGTAAKNFGFPHRADSPPVKAPEFGWDRNSTQRVESIEGGGILVHLNDNCVLVLFPFPFGGCSIGKKPANGELFKHMREPAAGDAGAAGAAP